MKTFSLKKEQIQKKWILIDAKNTILGRLASISANILRGKNKSNYTPNQDCGDNLIIINSDEVVLTGKKSTDKIYYRHTGYPGGLKSTNPKNMFEKGKSEEVIKKAIKGMIPNGPLGKKQLSNCKIYSNSNHPHIAQNPKTLNLSELNSKNVR